VPVKKVHRNPTRESDQTHPPKKSSIPAKIHEQAQHDVLENPEPNGLRVPGKSNFRLPPHYLFKRSPVHNRIGFGSVINLRSSLKSCPSHA